ncbi:MAG: hypothetical protein ABI646_11565, partial [Acidobacteriota bacterium]
RREDARTFIYAHWQSKKPAYVAIDFPCIDCAPTRHVFIDQNESGQWRIARVLEESRFPPRHRKDAFDVKYRPANREGRLEEKGPRILSFLDTAGEEIDSF